MARIRRAAVLLLLLVLALLEGRRSGCGAHAAQLDRRRTLLRTGVVETTSSTSAAARERLLLRSDAGAPLAAPTAHSGWGPLRSTRQMLLQLPADLPAPQVRALLDALHNAGAVVSGYLPDDTWLVLVPEQAEAALHGLHGARLVDLAPQHKLAPEWGAVTALAGNASDYQQLAGGASVRTLLAERRRQLIEARGGASTDASARTIAAGSSEGSSSSSSGESSSASDSSGSSSTNGSASVAGSSSNNDHDRVLAVDADSLELLGGLRFKTGAHPPKLLITVNFPTVAREDLQRLASSGGSSSNSQRSIAYHPAAAAVTDWAAPLAAAVGIAAAANTTTSGAGCVPELRAGGGGAHCAGAGAGLGAAPTAGTLSVAVCRQHLGSALQWLVAQPAVRWVAPAPAARLHNAFAAAITQGMHPASASEDPRLPSMRPLLAAGLDGRGQIVGSGDSGVDMDSCFVWDPKVDFAAGIKQEELPFSIAPGSTTNDGGVIVGLLNPGARRAAFQADVFRSDTHRKVALYIGFGDMKDTVGHGTHTAVTIAGSRYDAGGALDRATGMAPAARLAIMDLSGDKGGYVSAPDDLAEAYFPFTYEAGARIHSDSWGSDSITYDTSAASIDQFTWDNPDFLSIFAAGNYGDINDGSARTTVTSPATSKNVLAVGASLTIMDGYTSAPTVPVYSAYVEVLLGGEVRTHMDFRVVKARFGGPVKLGVKYPLVAASPTDACGAVAPAGDAAAAAAVRGAFVLAMRGNCYFSDKLQAAQAAGGLGVLLTNDKQEGYFVMEATEGSTAGVTIPMIGVPLSLGRQLWGTANSSTLDMTITLREASAGFPSYEDIAGFSSFGPAKDGRVKPEIVAPGRVTSARSDGTLSNAVDQCATVRQQGTSMAAPVVAGNAALVRQYFTDGYYPSGAAGTGVPFKPSGMLIKAALIAGATNMVGNTEAQLPLEPAPSFRQGFGRANLTRALPLSTSARQRMQVVDLAPLEQGGSHSYCLTATGGGEFVAMLVWYDYPAGLGAAKTLVNDLDLTVKAAGLGGATLLGNGWEDDVNNAERVAVDDMPAGNVQITVSAKRVYAKAGAQRYALVVVGAFDGILASEQNPDSLARGAQEGASCDLSGASSALRLSGPRGGATNGTVLTVNFDLTGLGGDFASGNLSPDAAQNVSCRMVLVSGARGSNNSAAAAAGENPLLLPANGEWARGCVSPAKFATPQAGRYVFELRVEAADGRVAERQLPLIVDREPPVAAAVAPNGGASGPVPSTVTFNVNATDAPPGAASGVSAVHVMLSKATTLAPSSTGARASDGAVIINGGGGSGSNRLSSSDLSSSSSSGGSGGGGGAGSNGGHRRLLAEDPNGPSIKGGDAVAWGTWQASPSNSSVTFVRLPSGSYSLAVRAVDAAGNIGPASVAVPFVVDASLLTPEQQTEADAARLRMIIGIAAGVGGGLVLIALGICLCVWLRRRRARQWAVEQEQGRQQAAWQQWQTWSQTGQLSPHVPGSGIGRIPVNGAYAPPSPVVVLPAHTPPTPSSGRRQGSGGGGTYPAVSGGWPLQAPAPATVPGHPNHHCPAVPGGAVAPGINGAAAGVGGAQQRSSALEADDAELFVMLDQRDREESAVRAAIQASLEEENLKRAVAASLGRDPGAGVLPPAAAAGAGAISHSHVAGATALGGNIGAGAAAAAAGTHYPVGGAGAVGGADTGAGGHAASAPPTEPQLVHRLMSDEERLQEAIRRSLMQ